MNRTTAIFGRDTHDFRVSGTQNSALKATVQVNFQTVGVMTGHYIENGYSFYDVQEFIPDYKPKLPTFSGILEIDYQQFANLTLRYSRNGVELSSVSYDALKGAGQRRSRQDGSYLTEIPVKFLTNLPRVQEIPTTGLAYLSLPLNYTGIVSALTLRATATMANGEVVTKNIWTGDPQPGTVYMFDVSPYVILQQFATTPKSYTLQVFKSDNTLLSEAMTYILTDETEYLTLVYCNSFGRYDVINAVCDYEFGHEVTPQRVQTARLTQRANTEGRRKLSVDFLRVSEEMKEPILELLYARQIYLFDKQRQIPLDCTTTASTFLQTAEYSERVPLEFYVATLNNNY